ncbi:DUF1343 domain-containing protein [Candidatus Babeliales bacterium]|nr:DUF1343 domain-containing protein [Candidatus Babeliales bacterium]
MDGKLTFLIKFICIAYLVFLVPRLILNHTSFSSQKTYRNRHVLLGIENFVYSAKFNRTFKNIRFGLVCDRASRDQSGLATDKLLRKNNFRVNEVFSPDELFAKKDVRLKSSFSKKIRSIDTFLVDLQGRGMSGDGTLQQLRSIFKTALQHKKKVLITDRPNPLGSIVEGPGTLAWRHGLTTGELALFLNKYYFKNKVSLTVISLKRWRRNFGFFGLPFWPISDSVPSLSICQGLTFLEPMESLSPVVIRQNLQSNLQGVLFAQKEKLSEWELRFLKRICWKLGLRSTNYSIYDEKRKENLYGVKVSVKADMSKFSAFNTFLTIARFLKNRQQIKLSFGKDLAKQINSSQVQRFLQGIISFDDLEINIEKSLAVFYDKIKPCCLYKPLPNIVSPQLMKA